jgi:hypothetical protein
MKMHERESCWIDDLVIAGQFSTIDFNHEWISNVTWLREEISPADFRGVEDAVTG